MAIKMPICAVTAFIFPHCTEGFFFLCGLVMPVCQRGLEGPTWSGAVGYEKVVTMCCQFLEGILRQVSRGKQLDCERPSSRILQCDPNPAPGGAAIPSHGRLHLTPCLTPGQGRPRCRPHLLIGVQYAGFQLKLLDLQILSASVGQPEPL